MNLKDFVPSENIGSVMLDDSYLLEGLVKAIRPHYVVEIGTFVGTSTVVMANALEEIQNTSKIYTVDKNDHDVMKKLGGLGLAERVEFYQQDSYDFAKMIVAKLPFIDFVFYDGEAHVDKYFEHFELLKTKMKPGSIYAVHDYNTRATAHRAFLDKIREAHITIPTNKGLTLIQI
jgi:predicted O-methyltransferase YrrM